jgi:hypothetical protein
LKATKRHDMAEEIAIEHIAWLRGRGVTLPSLCASLNFLNDHFTNWDQAIDFFAREWLRINGYTKEESVRNYTFIPHPQQR